MGDIPSDIKYAIGRLFVLCSVTSDPALLLRLTRALMSSVRACEAQLYGSFEGGTEHLPQWETYRNKIDVATVAYATSSDAWSTVMITCADVADYFYAICLMDDLIEIEEGDFDLTTIFTRNNTPQETNNDNRNPEKYLRPA
jgi:hypothetical protein